MTWTAMMSEHSFLSGWRARLKAGQVGVVLVEAGHPLEVYVGLSDLAHPVVQIRSEVKPALHQFSELVLVTRNQQDRHWVLSLSLQDVRFTDVFLRLVAHLVSASRRDLTAESAWRSVAAVLEEWKRLLQSRPEGLLGLDELRGLIGELWLVLHRFAKIMPMDQAVAGWLGPLNAPQDFWYEATGFHEAKSIGPSATRLKISSAHQLDEEGMEILVLQVPQVAEPDIAAVNLVTLVRTVSALLLDSGAGTTELDMRIKRLGVDLDHPYYADTWFRVTTVETLHVSGDFPAIRHSALPDGIDRVRYSIERSVIAPFIVATERVEGRRL
jgi:hypothetical protein